MLTLVDGHVCQGVNTRRNLRKDFRSGQLQSRRFPGPMPWESAEEPLTAPHLPLPKARGHLLFAIGRPAPIQALAQRV